jgi:ABC-2 type transport system ATP-binding protein
VRVRFKEEIDPANLLEIQGVALLARSDGNEILLQVSGEMDKIIKCLADYPVTDLESDRLTLEEVFLAYYSGEKKGRK